MNFLPVLLANFPLVFLLLAFVAVVLLMEGLYLKWSATRSPEARKVEQRLHVLAAGAAPVDDETSVILKQRMLSRMPALQRLLFSVPRLRTLDRSIEQAGLHITVSRLLAISLGIGGVAAALASLASLPALLCVALGAAAAALPFAWVRRRRAARLRRIDVQLPEALDLICRGLRAGHALSAALQMVGEELADPIGGEFRITHEEINYGISLQQALTNLAARVPSTDVGYFVIAVLIQRDSGGNLTEVLGNLAFLMRERFKLFEKARVLSAEGRLSAWILSLLPFIVATVINLINPEFMRVLWTDPMGIRMIGIALGAMVIGILWMRKIVQIHV